MNTIAKAGALIVLTLVLLFGGPWPADANDLIWGTFLGGSSTESGHDIVLDNSGNIYVTGQTFSDDFPFTSGAFDTIYTAADAFVAKLNAAGTALSYATFLGGNGNEVAYGIAVDDSGKAHVIGLTWSSDFPVTATAFDTSHNGQADVFVVKFNATGSALEYATFLGGTSLEFGNGIAVDDSGYSYVTGSTWSPNFPITSGACDTTYSSGEVFVTKLNLTGSDLVYSTFLGGTLGDEGYAIAVNDAGKAYVTGGTESNDFPTTTGAYDESHNGDIDVFVARLNISGSALDYASYLGGDNSDYGYGIALDGSDYAYLTGATYYSANFPYPTTSGAYDTTHNGDTDCFLTKINSAGSNLSYSTLLGGNNSDVGYGIALDRPGHAYVTGETYSANFPTTTGAYDDTLSGAADGFLARLSAPGSVLDYSTYLGGSSDEIGYGVTMDNARRAYVVGETYSADFPVTSAALDTNYSDGEAFVAKLSVGDTTTPEAIDDLSIALESPPPLKGSNIRLRWSEPFSVLAVSRYVIYRSTATALLGDSLAGTTDTTYLDIGATGNVDTNYCYAVKAVDTDSNISDESNKVGEHDYDLKSTTGTDYTWISLPFGYAGLDSASDLETYIEASSDPTITCYTISEWNATAQTYTNYTTIPIPQGNFALQPGHAYRVEVNDNAVCTLVGDVLPADSVSFNLKTTTGTDYTWISTSLHMASLDSASDLEAHIEANSSPATDCYTISEWNATAQTYTNYTTVPIPQGDFAVKPGRSYRVEVSVDAVWPSGSKAVPGDGLRR